jgi:hypothetical protein
MRKPFNIIFLLSILFACISCNSRGKIDDEIRAFYGTHVELPIDSMTNVSASLQTGMYKHARHIYVMYVDSTSCSDCAISHIGDWSQLNLLNAYKQGTLKYLFVVAPKHSQIKHVLDIIRRDTLSSSFVYVDTTSIFERRNPNLPTNKLLHTFLVDRNWNVELVGNPIANTEIKSMLKKIVEKEQHTKRQETQHQLNKKRGIRKAK